jgi:hypothetical protein
MSLGSYSIITGMMSLIGLLTFAPEQAPQKHSQDAETTFMGVNDAQKSESRPESGGPLAVKATATSNNPDPTGGGAGSVSPVTTAVPPPELIQPLTLANEKKLTPLDKAYLDVFTILRGDGACSRFYGGPPVIQALNTLTLQLKPSHLDRAIALRMAGKTSFISDYASGFSYRIFEKADLNLNGSFYSSNRMPNAPKVPGIGQFSAATREARVTILLHELGHLIRRSRQQWLLPDDGGDPSLSQQNTARVLEVCGEEIRALAGTSFAQELENAQLRVEPDEVVALAKSPIVAP